MTHLLATIFDVICYAVSAESVTWQKYMTWPCVGRIYSIEAPADTEFPNEVINNA